MQDKELNKFEEIYTKKINEIETLLSNNVSIKSYIKNNYVEETNLLLYASEIAENNNNKYYLAYSRYAKIKCVKFNEDTTNAKYTDIRDALSLISTREFKTIIIILNNVIENLKCNKLEVVYAIEKSLINSFVEDNKSDFYINKKIDYEKSIDKYYTNLKLYIDYEEIDNIKLFNKITLTKENVIQILDSYNRRLVNTNQEKLNDIEYQELFNIIFNTFKEIR